MWSSIKIAALALMALSSGNLNVDAQSTTTTTSTSTTTVCQVGGLTVTNNYRYVAGRHGIEGSIYATCSTDNKPKCFVDTRVRDAASAEAVSCDDDVIHESRRRLGVYLSGSDHYWPQGIACYSYGSSFTATQQGVFASAMNEYHTKTAVRFVTLDECKAQYPTACGGCTQHFQIVNAAGANDCYATLGYAPSARMDLNFGSGCFNGDGGFRVAVHELGHVIGLIHEHTHPNRQVVVLRSDLTLSPDNYMKEKNGLTTSYDSGSVMHYSRETGICIPKGSNTVYCDIDQSESDGCVVPTADMCDTTYDAAFGRATTLAASDIATIARIYGSGGQVVATPAPTTPSTTPVPVPPTTQAPQTPVVSPVVTPAPVVSPVVTPAPVPAPVPATTEPITVPAPVPAPVPATTEPITVPAPVPAPVPATTEPVTVPAPVPAPVAETEQPIQEPVQGTTDDATNWNNMNQQSQVIYPAATTEEVATTEPVAERSTDSATTEEVATSEPVAEPATDDTEARGAVTTTTTITAATGGSTPVQVFPPASTPAPATTTTVATGGSTPVQVLPPASTPAPMDTGVSTGGKKPHICDY